MIKKGFTLAETLITLGLIGIVAAITLPTLNKDINSSQIGPKLAKAVAAFEQANIALLNANSVDTITETKLINTDQYYNELSKYLKISATSSGYLSKDGIIYNFEINKVPTNNLDSGYLQRIGDVTIDINGASKPNTPGTDTFYFSWWNDGSLRPKGATNWDGSGKNATTWEDKCPLAEKGSVDEYEYCAGHIFENNLKVLYR